MGSKIFYGQLLAASFLLTACAAQQATNGSGETIIPVTHGGGVREFKVQKNIPSGANVQLSVQGRNAIKEMALIELTKSLQNTGGLGADSTVDKFGFPRLGGQVVVDLEKNVIDVNYDWTSAANFSRIVARYIVKISESGDYYNMTMQCPSSMRPEVRNWSLTGILEWDHAKISKNLVNACNTAEINIKWYDSIKGEIDSPFNETSVFANFRRRLHSVTEREWAEYKTVNKATTLDIEKSEKFLLKTPRSSVILAIKAYPYRNGSKTVYVFDYPYVISGRGTTTFDRKEVEDIKRMIVSIAND
jgi:hypothetical protein